MARRTLIITYLTTYLLAVGSVIRYLVRFRDDRSWSFTLLLGVYLVLLFSEPIFFRRHRPLTYIYLVFQMAIISMLATMEPNVDYWAALAIPLVVQIMHYFPQRTGFIIVGIITVIMAILMIIGPSPEVGLPLILIYTVIYFLLASFIALIQEAEAASEESQKQQAELQNAHRQLQSYTTQAGELAVLDERNRMARNLHDSVTQTIFSMRLTAEAANMLLDQNPAKARAELDKLQLLAKSALAEIRSLVFELRPTAVTELGLVPALRHHLMTLEREHGLIVDLQVSGELHLRDVEARQLFRISQEALNNVVKYAQTDTACLILSFEGNRVFLQVEDQGIGFEPAKLTTARDHIGLTSMKERVEAMGGVLTIDSHPGQGTRVTVEVTSTEKEGNDGQD
jgi:signal transduction histidine kinase